MGLLENLFSRESQGQQSSYSVSVKCLPILFCLDISSSMGKRRNGNPSSMELLNHSMSNLIGALRENNEINLSAEVAFLTFGEKVESFVNFQPLRKLKSPPVFKAKPKRGTRLSVAVRQSLRLLDEKIYALNIKNTPYYPPFLIIVTDGDPDDKDLFSQPQSEVIDELKARYRANIFRRLYPFVIVTGGAPDDDTVRKARRYTASFPDGFFHIRYDRDGRREQFDKVFRVILRSVTRSISLHASDEDRMSEIVREESQRQGIYDISSPDEKE